MSFSHKFVLSKKNPFFVCDFVNEWDEIKNSSGNLDEKIKAFDIKIEEFVKEFERLEILEKKYISKVLDEMYNNDLKKTNEEEKKSN